jgi:hypothetical protein
MTTASNSINTDSIETITGTTTLTIGGVATDVSLKDTTTQALTVTGRTTSEIQTNTITPTYTTYPDQSITPTQRAYQLFNACSNPQMNNPIDRTGLITTVIQNNTTFDLLTIPLPIGVWSISYTIRFRSLGSSPMTYVMTTATLGTPVTYGGVQYPKYLGLQAFPIALANSNLTNRTSFSGNTVITNNIAGNVLSLQFACIYTNSNLTIWGLDASIVNTFMIATRIA